MALDKQKVKELLKASGLKHTALASFLGISKQSLNAILGRTNETSVPIIQKIAEFLKVPMSTIYIPKDDSVLYGEHEILEILEENKQLKQKVADYEKHVSIYMKLITELESKVDTLIEQIKKFKK